MRTTPRRQPTIATRIVQQSIRLYQRTLSPDHGWLRVRYPLGYCRFHPTCSQYMVEALERHGLLKGLFQGMYRLVRCNPWNRGGLDPVH